MNPENIEKVWQYMSDQGQEVGTLDEFTTAIQDPGNLEKVHSYMSSNDQDVGDLKTFSAFTIGDTQEERKPLGGVPQQEQDFEQELATTQKETDEAFREGQGVSGWLGRRKTQLQKTWVKLKEDAVALAEITADKLGADELAGDLSETRQGLIRDKQRLSAKIPSPLKKSFGAKVVNTEFEGKPVEVETDSDGNFRQMRDEDGFDVPVPQKFVDEFNNTGLGREGDRQFPATSLATTAEETLYDLGIMVLGTKGAGTAAKAATQGLSAAAAKTVTNATARAAVGSIAAFQSIGDNYAENLQEFDGDVDKAANVAVMQSAITGMITTLFPAIESGGMIQSTGFKSAVKKAALEGGEKTLMQKALGVGRQIGGEIVEENIDNISSNYVAALNGAEGAIIDAEEIIATTAISALVSAPVAVFNSVGNVSEDNVLVQGLYHAARNEEGKARFEEALTNSNLSEDDKNEKRALVEQISNNVKAGNLTDEQGVALTAEIANKHKLTKLQSGDLEPKIAEALQAKIDEIDNRINKIVKPTAANSSVVVAPFFNTTIANKKDADESRQSPEYQTYLENIANIGSMFGLQTTINESIGGYKNDQGEEITEISNIITIDGDLNQAEQFAAILGAMAPEVQEATIAAQIQDGDTNPGNIDQLSIEVSDIDGTIEALKDVGITDYTIDDTNGVLTLLDFSKGNDPNFDNKIENLIISLENKGIENGKQRKESIESRYITAESRKEILSGLEKSPLLEGERGQDFGNTVKEAIRRNEEFLQKGQTEEGGVVQEDVEPESFQAQELTVSKTMAEEANKLTSALNKVVTAKDAALKGREKDNFNISVDKNKFVKSVDEIAGDNPRAIAKALAGVVSGAVRVPKSIKEDLERELGEPIKDFAKRVRALEKERGVLGRRIGADLATVKQQNRELKDAFKNEFDNAGDTIITSDKISNVLNQFPNVSNKQISDVLKSEGINIAPKQIQTIRDGLQNQENVQGDQTQTKGVPKGGQSYKQKAQIRDPGMDSDGNLLLTTEAINEIRTKFDMEKTRVTPQTVDLLIDEARQYMSTDQELFSRETPIVHEILNGTPIMDLDQKMIAIRRAMDQMDKALEAQMKERGRARNERDKREVDKRINALREDLHYYTVAYNKLGTLGGRLLRYRQEKIKSDFYSTTTLRGLMTQAKGGKLSLAEEALVQRQSKSMIRLRSEIDALLNENALRSESSLAILAKRQITRLNSKAKKGRRGSRSKLTVADAAAKLRKTIEKGPC